MINEIKIVIMKHGRSIMTYIPILSTIIFFCLMNWYINHSTWNHSQISLFTASFNAVAILLLSINVFQVMVFEENIGHFNHLLSKPRRKNWLFANFIFVYLNFIVCCLITSLNVVLHSRNIKITLIFFISSLLFNLLTVVLLVLIGLFVKGVLTIILGIILFIFDVYFGMEVLGDGIWYYLPITYATRYTRMYLEHSIPYIFTLICYVVVVSILFSLLILLFEKWEGRKIKD